MQKHRIYINICFLLFDSFSHFLLRAVAAARSSSFAAARCYLSLSSWVCVCFYFGFAFCVALSVSLSRSSLTCCCFAISHFKMFLLLLLLMLLTFQQCLAVCRTAHEMLDMPFNHYVCVCVPLSVSLTGFASRRVHDVDRLSAVHICISSQKRTQQTHRKTEQNWIILSHKRKCRRVWVLCAGWALLLLLLILPFFFLFAFVDAVHMEPALAKEKCSRQFFV